MKFYPMLLLIILAGCKYFEPDPKAGDVYRSAYGVFDRQYLLQSRIHDFKIDSVVNGWVFYNYSGLPISEFKGEYMKVDYNKR